MLSFWSIHQQQTCRSHVKTITNAVSVNNVICDRINCAAHIKSALTTAPEITISKTLTITDQYTNDNETKTAGKRFAYSLKLGQPLIQSVLNRGRKPFQKLVDLIFDALDAAIAAEQDYDHCYRHFVGRINDLYRFTVCYQIKNDLPLYKEMRTLMATFYSLIAINQGFSLARASLEGLTHIEACIPQISFPQALSHPVTCPEDVSQFIGQVLNNIHSEKEKISQDPLLIPVAAAFTLRTLDQIDDLAKSFTAVYEHYRATIETPRTRSMSL